MSTIDRLLTDAGSRYRVAIRTAVGWSISRSRYKSRRNARRAALWFLSLRGVHSVRVIDTAGEAVIEIHHPRRKPR